MDQSFNAAATANRSDTLAALTNAGYARSSISSIVLGFAPEQLAGLRESWNRLPPDQYLRDGGHYRFRRHSCFVQTFAPAALEGVAHRAHWQSTSYNALHGGIERWFEPVERTVTDAASWRQLVTSIGSVFAQVQPVTKWFIEAHQFRIDTADGIGRPTPEGAHRDGVDFVAVILIGRQNVRGGETRVFDADGPSGTRFTMMEPWSALLMDDSRVIHETTPIQPDGTPSFRDTLVLTYRAAGFQSR